MWITKPKEICQAHNEPLPNSQRVCVCLCKLWSQYRIVKAMIWSSSISFSVMYNVATEHGAFQFALTRQSNRSLIGWRKRVETLGTGKYIHQDTTGWQKVSWNFASNMIKVNCRLICSARFCKTLKVNKSARFIWIHFAIHFAIIVLPYELTRLRTCGLPSSGSRCRISGPWSQRWKHFGFNRVQPGLNTFFCQNMISGRVIPLRVPYKGCANPF
jgi:hypothetical protein